jgi:glucose/arabinose dehydrogenase
VTVAGLPAGQDADITVSGPSGFSRAVARSVSIPGLVPGSYAIDARSVSAGGTTFTPVVASQTVQLVAAAASRRITVTYGTGAGNLAITVNGVPAGTDAAVTVDGPGGFVAEVVASTTLNALAAGAYHVTAAAISSGDATTLVPAPAAQTIDVAAGATASATVTYAAAAVTLRAEEVVGGLSDPVHLTAPANDPRLFIVEQPGRIRIFKDGALLPVPFLDVTSRVNFGGERGLLSLAFDPAYAVNGRFYIYYTGAQGDIFVDRHTVSANPDVANTAFDEVIRIPHRQFSNHNGGHVLFGPDGMLYLGTGDGGGAGDTQNNGQNINSLLGKLLRLDVSTLPYRIPPDNPFAGTAGADEIWAYGLRNPWRIAFDGTGANARVFIADVGQNAWEEVNVADARAPGLNYGWRLMEGTHCFNPSSNCNTGSLTLPVHEYSHSQGCSIAGGYVYRGNAIPEVQGHYFYSDYCAGGLRSFRVSGGAAVGHVNWQVTVGSVLSFGMDSAGEMYILAANGRVYRVVK